MKSPPFEFSIPSKTFVLGEYAILNGQRCLIANTKPRFKLLIKNTGLFCLNNIPEHSPAGKFIRDQHALLKNYQLSFIDCHQAQGGFGASSAQFALCYALFTYLQHGTVPKLNDSTTIENLLTVYKNYAYHAIGIPPSGADLIAQIQGGLVCYDPQQASVTNYTWPFADIGFLLIRTNHKMATHEHLATLTHQPWPKFTPVIHAGITALTTADQQSFIESIRNFSKLLANYQLVAEKTQNLLAHMMQQTGVMAAKGCGALGADVIYVVYQQPHKVNLQRWCADNNLSISADETQLDMGIDLQVKAHANT